MKMLVSNAMIMPTLGAKEREKQRVQAAEMRVLKDSRSVESRSCEK